VDLLYVKNSSAALHSVTKSFGMLTGPNKAQGANWIRVWRG